LEDDGKRFSEALKLICSPQRAKGGGFGRGGGRDREDLTRQLESQKELRWDKMALRSFKTCFGSGLKK